MEKTQRASLESNYKKLMKKRRRRVKAARKKVGDLIPDPALLFPGVKSPELLRDSKALLREKRDALRTVLESTMGEVARLETLGQWRSGVMDLRRRDDVDNLAAVEDPIDAAMHEVRLSETSRAMVSTQAYAGYLYIYRAYSDIMISKVLDLPVEVINRWRKSRHWDRTRDGYISRIDEFMRVDMADFLLEDLNDQMEKNSLIVNRLMKCIDEAAGLIARDRDADGQLSEQASKRVQDMALAANRVLTPWADLLALANEAKSEGRLPFAEKRRKRGSPDELHSDRTHRGEL
jgi:hypothetical protein